MEVSVTRANTKGKFGKISRLELPNKSKIYITKTGWNLVTPKGIEVKLPWNEINLSIWESVRMGYVERDSKKIIKKALEIVDSIENPYPKDIFTWDNKSKLNFNRGRFNKFCFEFTEKMKTIVKSHLEEELEE